MKTYINLLLLFTVLFNNTKAQSLYFPPSIGSTWSATPPASLGWCQPKIDSLLTYLENENTKAFIVLKDGKIVIEKYFGTFTKDSLWYWASAGKTLTAFTIGIAQQEGLLSINDKTSQYLGTGWTTCTQAKEDLITIKHQLTMTSGLDDDVIDVYCTDSNCLKYKADAGTRWAYHNGPYTLLDGVIEAATGQTLNSYITQKIKPVTGITGAFYPSGYNNLFVSTARSMARFGLLILNKGNWNGTSVMTDTAYFNDMLNTSQSLNKSYGYLWWLNGKSSFMIPNSQVVFPGSINPHGTNDMVMALGKNGQFIDVVPSQNIVLIRMGNAPSGGDVPFTMNDSIWKKLNEAMCTPNYISNKTFAEPTITIFPNPAKQQFNVLFPNNNFSISIFDLTGRLVLEEKNVFDNIIIDCKTISNSMYRVQVKNENYTYNSHVIITE